MCHAQQSSRSEDIARAHGRRATPTRFKVRKRKISSKRGTSAVSLEGQGVAGEAHEISTESQKDL